MLHPDAGPSIRNVEWHFLPFFKLLNVGLGNGDELCIYDGGSVAETKKKACYDHTSKPEDMYLVIFSTEEMALVTLKTGGNPGMGVLIGYQKGDRGFLLFNSCILRMMSPAMC